MKVSYRLVNGLLVLASIIGMSFALYLEHVKHLQPCPLCIFQRVGLIATGVVALIAFLHHPKSNIMKRIYALLASLGVIWSTGVAARHIWIQHLPADQVPSCGPGLNYLIDVFPMKDVLAQVFTGSGECAKIDWTLFGFSLPELSIVFFACLTILCFWQMFRKL
ncbi:MULTISPECIES: disulfide bond formation protein B [Acinetobacter]|uniref:Disulfide bond formation protein B n=1 Tax=Acinetobacter pollinis TaxID=2605270 RepID=A0ABU6DTI5_9GAMM|nr:MULTISPECIES: disulfide bond formation protein B [Acinetobacter]MBF7691496.1 disulfide bond formation protein B [Acinetobacter pollinis]MBF7693332.1 disulfide bond formation protein B [Acinetobacter pollinis]MBF7699178.1 disulfide bond formation protein B [Acinetobacter pollinis]MBF7701533.1 disulfide bond formation protein B [Acinetobacter pollinis]MEB5477166.1 disulfide bond formation protein B [Acinetobacter pollinis]